MVSSKTCNCLSSGWMVAEDFAVAIITTPLKFVGRDLKVVAYTPIKVSTICLVLVESVFCRGGSESYVRHSPLATPHLPPPVVVSIGRCYRIS